MKKNFRKNLKFKKYSLLLLVVLTVVTIAFALSSIVIPKIMAGDTVVSDLHIQAQSEGNIISLHITDENKSDTKVVVPIPEGVIYKLNQTSNIGVTEDTVNHQLVIDWVEGQAKEANLQLEVKNSGVYDFVVQTVREEQPVNSIINVVQINNFKTSKETTTSAGSTRDTGIKIGVWGTAPFEVNEETGEMTVKNGNLVRYTREDWAKIGINTSLIKRITFVGEVFAPEDSNRLFARRYDAFDHLEDLEGLSNLNTSNVTSMSEMFTKSQLTTIDVSNFDTSKVLNMSQMFSYTTAQQIEGLANLNTSNVTSMNGMFTNSQLTTIDVSNFDTSKVLNMDSMFASSSSQIIDVSNFDTSKVEDMNFMFYDTKAELDVSRFDTSNVQNFTAMFRNTSSKKLDVSNFDTSQATVLSYMFNTIRASELDLSNFDTTNVLHMNAFLYTFGLKRLTLGLKFKFLMTAGLGKPVSLEPEVETTGKWIKEHLDSNAYSPTEFMQNYGNSDLTPGTYVAEIIIPGEITAETEIENLTHSNNSDEYYVNDEVRIDNTIHHKGDTWNFLYKTVIPEEITLDEESIKGYVDIEEGNKIDIPSESFIFDESSRVLEVNLKNIAEPSKEGNYYSAVDADFHYELTAKIKKDSLGKNLEVQTTISYFDSILRPKPDVNIKTDNKKIFGLDPRWNLEEKVKNLSRTTNYAVGDEIEITITAQNDNEFGAMNFFDLTEKPFSKDLDFVPGSAELMLPNGENKALPDSVYQEDKRIITTNVFSENNYVGLKPYQLRFKAKVRKSAYQKDIEFNSTLSGKNNLNKDIVFNGGTQKIKINFSGELRFAQVPDTMSFEDRKISNRTVESSRKDKDWKITVEDTRLEKKPWRVTTKILTPFKDTTGTALQSDILLFRKTGQEDQWIKSTSETDVHDGTVTKEDYSDVSWASNEGPLIQVAPGTVKVGQYNGVMQWSLIDAPA